LDKPIGVRELARALVGEACPAHMQDLPICERLIKKIMAKD
jgi:hypothetical protein